ncbi:amino acid adenylation domain-containing protein [Saccharopolyspora shandongensis]|uniref:amino acid adenylation domain-containing protein n=1 Tax=Saccharopolyspora shandongensis TaxID=418495 RepID=UPI0033CECD0D
MNAHDLVRRLDDLGVGLTLVDDRIRYRSRGAQLAPELVAEMKQHRDELVDILNRRAQLRWPPARGDVDDQERRGPLSKAQQTLWATNYFLEDGTYNVCGALRLRGELDDVAFAAALEDVHRRHPSLRTVFPVALGEPVQHVLPAVATPVVFQDFSHQPPDTALDECLRECARLADRKLPLDTAPPVSMCRYRLAEDDHVFVVVLHHVIADGVSVGVLLDDLAQCYNARLDGSSVEPSAGDVDMLDYARWEQEHLRYADLGTARRYWKERLSDAAFGPLPLPPPREELREDHRGGAYTAVIDAATTAAVRRLVSESRSSSFLVVSAAISSMLSRYTGREDMVVGMPVARRDRAGLEKLVGLLLDMIPVRLELGGGPSFADLVKRTRTAVLGAMGNAVVPSEIVLDEHAARGDAAGRALFNVIVTDAGTRLPEPSFRGLEASHLDVAQVGAKYDLNFLVRDDGDTLAIDVEYDRRAVGEQDVAAMTSMVRRILAQGAANPQRRAADLAAAPFGEIGAGAVGEHADRVPGADESLVGRLAAMAQTRGDAVAVSHDGTTLSYRELAGLVDRIARGLRREGFGAGDVVAISLPRGIDLVAAIVGVMGSGAACLVLDDSWPQARVDRVLADADARRIIAPEPDSGSGRVTVAQLAELGAAAAPSEPVPAQATAYVIYTSGSTGRPKGVHVTHHNLLSLLGATGDAYGFGADDTWTLFHACSFDVSMYEMFGCLLHGGRLVVVPQWTTREPEAFAQLLQRERVTVLSQTPSALSVMLPAIERNPSAAEHIRYVLFAGEALDRRLVDQWYQALGDRTQLVNMYGITETTVHASWRWLRPDDAHTAESDIGGPLPGTSLHILHDNGTSVFDRCVGEIYVGGPQVSAGYLGRPRETALRFVPDPFGPIPGSRMYRSGDLARRSGTGMSYLGRRDSQVQVNGFRIELSEIEEALAGQSGVAAAAAVTTPDDGGTRIVAVVVAEDGTDLSAAELIRGARAVLPRYMIPHAVAVVAELPLTNNGKLDRAAVVSAATAAITSSPRVSTPPQGPAETLLLELFREVLGDDSASTATDFLEQGGDSMHAIHLVGLARERGLAFSVRDVYEAPVLTELAARAVPRDQDATEASAEREPFSLLPAEFAGSFPDDVEDAYPMTAMQTGMIYHQEISPGAGVYHIVLSYRVRGTMDPVAFRAAAQAVTDAHPILRTSFDLGHAHGPVQRVHTAVDVPVEFEDLANLAPADQEARIRQVVETETASPFDLARVPLFRLVVLTLSADDYQLVFAHNHAILDGWSVNVFFEDLHAQYLDRLHGGSGRPLPRPRTRFADYVALEQRALADPADADFWRERTSPEAHLIAPGRSGDPVMRQLHEDLPGTIDELRAVAAQVGVPLKALLLAAHIRVVAWLTGHDDVVTSLVFACRPEEQDSDRMLGLFLNQLPVRVELADQSWAELARQVHRGESDMMRHRWYPHASIQQEHGSRPIFDSSFNFTDYHTTRRLVRDGSLEVLDSYELESTHYAFGSNYTVDVRTHELRMILEYDASAVARSTVALAAEAHRRILSAIVADPDKACRSTALPGVVDLARLLESELGAPESDEPAREVANGGAVVPESTVDQSTPVEPSLARSARKAWTEVLGVTDFGADTSFFEVGGSSLTAMRVVSMLRAQHGQLSMGAFMENPTVNGTARALSAASNSTDDAVAPVVDADPVGDGVRRYPLSRAQHQMWLLASKLPEVALFGMPGALQAAGPLDLDVLKRTLASLVRRHEALRTRIVSTDDGPEQVVEPQADLDIEVVDLSGHADPVADCEKLMAAAVREPIALDRAPLMRAIVYRIGALRHVIYLNIHHVVCDGWSLELLLGEAARTYRELAAGAGTADRPAAPGSGRLALARAEWAESPEARRQLTYWVDRLAPPWTSLAAGPSSRFAAADQATFVERLRSASCQRRLDRAAIEPVRDAARRHGLTEFMVVLTAFATALRSWSGQDDIRVATMLANRAQPGTEDVVGLVANTAVLRMQVGADADPVDLSREVQRACIGAYENQEVPFEDVLAALAERYPAEQRTGPMYEAMLVVQEETTAVAPDDGLEFSPYRSDRGVLTTSIAATNCEFVLGVTPDDGALVLNLRYKPAITDRAVAVELLDDIATALTATARAMGERA